MVSSKSVRSSGWSDIAARYGCSSKGGLRFSLLTFLFKKSLKMIKMKTGVEVSKSGVHSKSSSSTTAPAQGSEKPALSGKLIMDFK